MPMNECENNEVRDVLPLLASGGQVESSASVEVLIAGCEACREELALLKAARQALLRAPVVDAGRIARAVPAYGRAPLADPRIVPIGSRRTKAPAWRIAAAALLVVAAGTAITVRQAGDDLRTTPVVASGDSADSIVQVPVGPVVASDPAGPVRGDAESGTLTGVPRNDAGTQMTFGGGLEDLSEEDLVALLAALDDSEPLAAEEPDEAFPSMSVEGEEEI